MSIEEILEEKSVLLSWISAQIEQNGYVIIDGFFTFEETKAFKDELLHQHENGNFKKAAIGQDQNKSIRSEIRGDFISWISRNEASTEGLKYLHHMDALSLHLNRSFYLGLNDSEFHFAYYPEGAGYQMHLDCFLGDSARVISVICYLNQEWEEGDGGELKIYTADGIIDTSSILVQPLGGRIVCFESARIYHEVLPSKKDRYSITGWLKRSADILHLPIYEIDIPTDDLGNLA